MSLEFLRKHNFLILYLVVIGGVNLFLQTLPLTNVFGYEFSAINSLILSFLSGIYIISVFKSSEKTKNFFNTSQLFEAWLWMLSIPFIISIIKSLVFGFCSFWDGLLFYLIITSPSVVIGSAIGAISFHFVKKFRLIFFILIYLLILLTIPILEIYFNPQIYLYNPLFAYFPGTIYDEGITVDFNLILYRVFNLIFFILILKYFIRWWGKEASFNKRTSFLILVILFSGVFYIFISPLFGYTTTNSCLKSSLSNRVESKHFIIYADKNIGKEELELIVLNQEYYYSDLTKYFTEQPETKITSYIFFNSDQKKNLFGSGAADVAKPWLNSIYVSADTWESTLKHEIAHCFTAGFGSGVFKIAAGFNPALIEGVAEAADGFYDENTIHFMAALAYKNDYKIDINNLFSHLNFFGSVSSLSYIYSGSFIQYLVEQFGIEKVKQFYKTNNFSEAFKTSLAEVTDNYEIFLDTLTVEYNKEQANYYYGRKALISKVCPRYVASALNEGWKLYQQKEFHSSEKIFADILSKAENYSAVIGLSKIYEDSDSLFRAIQNLNSYVSTFENTSSEFDLKFRLAELYVKNSELAKAFELYSSLSLNNPNKRLKLLADTRLALIENGKIEAYVFGSDFDKYAILKELNSKSYNYSSIPLMIDLSISLEESYESFLSFFKNDLVVKDDISSYSVLKLSEYMLKNSDIKNARKMAGFARRYKLNDNLLKLTEENYKKTEWFFRNSESTLEQTTFGLN
ncbi:MAG: hypothetical protein IPM14_16440 [bacterium]|nr:hypothetical protein [bacterium]